MFPPRQRSAAGRAGPSASVGPAVPAVVAPRGRSTASRAGPTSRLTSASVGPAVPAVVAPPRTVRGRHSRPYGLQASFGRLSGQDVLHHPAAHVRQAEVAAAVAVG